ncbi:MAG: DUF5696 domain-containing protein [Oscillospiraceae bacterium]|nr:DUF5696 domain-containing protein [Oscillospiraceae bacterium]
MPMKLGTKLLLGLIGIAAFIVLVYQGYVFVYFRAYSGYEKYLDAERGTHYEEGRRFAPLPGGGNVPGMVLVAESPELEMYTDTESTNVAVYDKRTGLTTYACPPDADDDPLASSRNKSLLKSPLTVEYFNARSTPGQFLAYEDAIRFGSSQVAVEGINGGVRYIYTLGNLQVSTGIVPIYLYRNRLDDILDKLEDETDRQNFEMRYTEAEDAPEGVWTLRSGAAGAATIRRLLAMLEAIGYTEEDYLRDSMETNVEGAVVISVEVPLEYRLEGDKLVVSVPTSRIVENGGARIDKIHVLRFFGAAGTDEDGYLFVPNGSGSLIDFNNGRTWADDYSQFVYGTDRVTNDFIVLGNTEMVRLPVFGLHKEGGQTVFAQIEEGQSFAQISAFIAGKGTSYNGAAASFIIRGSGSLMMFGVTGSEGEMPVVEADFYVANLTVRYSFLPEEYEGYSGMARYYRERLIREGVLGDRVAQGDIPLYLDMIGAVLGTKFALSIQYQGIIPMTTYAQAEEILDIFSASGISNQVVNYQGWFNRGYYHDAANRINPVRQLGSKRELEALGARLEEQGGKLYADVIFQNVPYRAKRYNWAMENSRYYGGGMTVWWAEQTCPDCYQVFGGRYPERWQALVSPKFLPRYADAFVKRIEDYDVTGISLRDLGDSLHSDRKRTEFIDREHALSIVTAQMDKIVGTGMDVMVSGGNAYALYAADDLINVPLMHSDFLVVDAEVPFYQMVVHGYIPYAGNAFNRSDGLDETDSVLRLIEFGASPRFTLSYEEASEMKYTGLNHYFGTHYQNWTGVAVEVYNTVNPVLSRVRGSVIVRHEITPDGLRAVTYDNGVQILVNYTDAELSYEGVAVAAKGFEVREGVAA